MAKSVKEQVAKKKYAEKMIKDIARRLEIDAYNDPSIPSYVHKDILFLWEENQFLITRVAKAEGWDA